MTKKIALIILDGFGITAEPTGNAVLLAKKPNIEKIFSSHPKCLLKASSEEVGLPWGEFGNSEVGHTTIGLGRVLLQDLPQIDESFKSGKIKDQDSIREIADILEKNTNANLHLIGMLSDGAVHGHIRHIVAMIKLIQDDLKLSNKIILHLITDGRDVAESSAKDYLAQMNEVLNESVVIGSLGGRYFYMDRDKNWNRIEKAYVAVVGKAARVESPETVIDIACQNKQTDEFIEPKVCADFKFDFESDVALFMNFRADRAIELTRSFVDQKFDEFERSPMKNFYTLTVYDDNIPAKSIFSNLDLNDPASNPLANSMSEVIASAGLSQYHIAETEKFAHVTYFFSGGIQKEFSGQKNVLIESEKVKSYDLAPKMRAEEITKEILSAAQKETNFIVANIANGDMVGHSGIMEASVQAVEEIDRCLGLLYDGLLAAGYEIFITADHGNCDEMIDLKSKKPNKEHSINPVPFVYINAENTGEHQPFNDFLSESPIGIISDIAPTVLGRLELEYPKEFSGANLIESMK